MFLSLSSSITSYWYISKSFSPVVKFNPVAKSAKKCFNFFHYFLLHIALTVLLYTIPMATVLKGSVSVTVKSNPSFTLTTLDYETTTIGALKGGALSNAISTLGKTTLGYRVFANEIVGAPLCLLNIATQAGENGVIQATVTNTTGTTIGILIGEGIGGIFSSVPGVIIGGVIGSVLSTLITEGLNYGWDFLQDKYEIDTNNILDKSSEYFGEALDREDPTKDPIIFDLDGDGIETTTTSNGVYFDYENDGFTQQTAWVGNDDGLLVSDSDSNGSIDNESELVKNLSAYDTNNDGVINSNDTNFANLQLLKGDGTLTTLSDAGVASIDLATNSSGTTDTNDNTQTYWGTYTDNNGVTRKYGDYELQANNASAVMSDVIEVFTEIEALPDASNYGTVYIDDFAKVA